MNVLFCDNLFGSNATVDPDFEDEFISAKQNGFTIHLFSYENLTKDQDVEFATRSIQKKEKQQTIIYRGWMLKPKQYSLLYDALLRKNYRLINTPTAYQNCHYFPDSYRFISDYTPQTIWLKVENLQVDYTKLLSNVEIFGSSALIVKDFVKSQKHYWETACFIPSAADKEKVKAVVSTFVALQNTDLNEGIVIRKFEELQELTDHSKSGMPLKLEYRLFFLNKQLLGCYDYWEEGVYSTDEHLPINFCTNVAQKVESNFFSMDIAKTKDGKWIIIELGDGQVAGLPDSADRSAFYSLLAI